MPRFAYVNGRYTRHADAAVHIEDRGYQFADGVYEVCEVARGFIVAILTFLASSLLVDLPVEHAYILFPALFLVGWFFASLGVLIGVRAEQFDDVSFAQTFILQPLIFLGGVFYSASLLPEPYQTLTHFNPVFYMINLVRYGFVGFSEVSVAFSKTSRDASKAAYLVSDQDWSARQIVRAISQDRARVLLGPDARTIDVVSRVLPGRSSLIGRALDMITG